MTAPRVVTEAELNETLSDLATAFEKDSARHSLDELFRLTYQYKSARALTELFEFIGKFRSYSPYNAMLVHVQMPGARYVAPASRWLKQYDRRIRPGAKPLVILQPMGPVMFVFDVSDTEAGPNSPALPPQVERPFEVLGGRVAGELALTIENAQRDGIRITEHQAGSQRAGSISKADGSGSLKVISQRKPELKYVAVQLRYELLLNSHLSREARYATLAHELGHLYCGHLGTPNQKWWPNRPSLELPAREFEAESVCYLICKRLGIDNPSEQYLSGYVQKDCELPPISLDCVLRAAGLLESMGRASLKPRKEEKQ